MQQEESEYAKFCYQILSEQKESSIVKIRKTYIEHAKLIEKVERILQARITTKYSEEMMDTLKSNWTSVHYITDILREDLKHMNAKSDEIIREMQAHQ